MKQLRYILSLLCFFLGFFSENLKAEVVTIKSAKVETLSEQNFQEQTSKEKWLGLLHLQKESLHKNQILPYSFSIRSFNQNFSEELCLKGNFESSKLGFQLGKKSTSYQGNGGWNEIFFNDDKDLVDSWDILRKNGRTELKVDIPSIEALNKIRKHSRLSELGLTDDMLGRIQGIDNVSYVEMLDEVEKAMDALPAGKTKEFSKIIQNGEKRGLVNTDPTNGIYDRRHSWLTLKVIQDNSDFLKKADAIEFEAALETIDGIPQSVPDLKLTISEGGVTKVKIGEVYAGTAGAKSNLASQSLTYFNAVSDIRDFRLFRRMNVADKAVAKSAVIDAWKKGGVTSDQKVRNLFTDYYNRINDVDVDVIFTQTQLESFLITNDNWFDLIFNSSF